MAKKKGDQFRFSCDFRYLNSVTAPVLGMPAEKGMYVRDTDASVVAISGILHQEQEWNGKTVLRPIAYGSKVLSDTEMKYGAPKAEMFVAVTFVENYRAYLGSEPLKLQAKPYAVGQYVWVFQNVIPPKGSKELLKKWRGPFMIMEVHQQGRFYRLSTGRAAHYENLKPHVPSPEDWCVPQNMEGLEYLLVEPDCEVNEKGTREKTYGNEDLSLDDNEKIEADSEAEFFVEEDWNDPEKDEVPKWTEPDLLITAGTTSGNRKWTDTRYNRYGDDFLIDKIQPHELTDELLSVGELVADDEWQIINDGEHYPKEDYSTPEQKTDLEQSEIERRENTNLRIPELLRITKI